MIIKSDDFQKLLQRQLTRKEFLQVIGLMVISLVGISRLLGSVDTSNKKPDMSTTDYSAGPYGD